MRHGLTGLYVAKNKDIHVTANRRKNYWHVPVYCLRVTNVTYPSKHTSGWEHFTNETKRTLGLVCSVSQLDGTDASGDKNIFGAGVMEEFCGALHHGDTLPHNIFGSDFMLGV